MNKSKLQLCFGSKYSKNDFSVYNLKKKHRLSDTLQVFPIVISPKKLVCKQLKKNLIGFNEFSNSN